MLFGIVTLVGMSLGQTLLELTRRHLAALPDRDRADFEDELDRLRMLRVAEQGLGLTIRCLTSRCRIPPAR